MRARVAFISIPRLFWMLNLIMEGYGMKWLKGAVAVIFFLVLAGGLFVRTANKFARDGEIVLRGLDAPVKVVRDEKGMPYIYAQKMRDAFCAQGYVTAQERLFQMELTKLFSEGCICELAGEAGKASDIEMRTLGFYRNAKKHAALLNPHTKVLVQAYVDGINEYIRNGGSTLHLEFKLAGIKPGLWAVEDVLAILYYMGWNTGANASTEIIAQMLIEKLGAEKAAEIFPININPDNKLVGAAETRRASLTVNERETGISNDPLLMRLLRKDLACAVGSNNWTVNAERSASGKPIVANDPHLDARMLPGPWLPMAIILPGKRSVGVSFPGMPGMIICRTTHAAYGITNSYGDTQDLYIETIDPKNPDNYLEGGRSLPFGVITETMKVKDKKSPNGYREEIVTIKLTRRGPVVSGILKGLKTEKCVTLRLSAYETMGPGIGIDRLVMASSVDDIRKGLQEVTMAGFNFVFADDRGNIGWQTTGRIPIRSQKDSTVPFVVKDGVDNWKGFIPYEKMPQSYNPRRGWLGTCNHNTVPDGYPYYVSSYFAPDYRYSRLTELMHSKQKTTPDDHWAYQRDAKNLLAEKIAPVFAAALDGSEDTKAMAEILKTWDFVDSKESPAPAVFQMVFHKLAMLTCEDELGVDLAKTMLDSWYFWQSRFEAMILGGESAWFDDVRTPEKENMNDMIRMSALAVMKEKGSNPAKWKWGKMHRLQFVSPIMRKGPLKGVLGGGSHQMDGSGETLYRAMYKYNETYNPAYTASLRMVADLADTEKVLAVLPGGTTGRLFDRHQTDQIPAFMSGEKMYWWLSDEQIQKNAKHTLSIVPGK